VPRSPSEGAATRGPADLEIEAVAPPRDRRLRTGVDRRTKDLGPPGGIERRRYERRSHDRRSHPRSERRSRERRSTVGRRGGSTATSPRHPRVASRQYGPPTAARARTPKLLRALLITLVAVACLLAATLTEKSGAAARHELTGAASSSKTTSPKPKPGSAHAKSGSTSATLTWTRRGTSDFRSYTGLKLTIKGGGKTTKATLKGIAKAAYLTKPQLQLTDVTGDGKPDAIVTLYTGGAHCCEVTSIATSTTTAWAKPVNHDWRDGGYKLQDLGGTAAPEFVGVDVRFIDAYAAHAASIEPIQIFSMTTGTLVDVTRQFPDAIAADLVIKQQAFASTAITGDDAKKAPSTVDHEAGRQALAATLGDLLLLGRTDDAKALVAQASARGDFADSQTFTGNLGHDLKTWGYVTDPTLIGLTDSPTAAPEPIA
jgi:hypothetical protein